MNISRSHKVRRTNRHPISSDSHTGVFIRKENYGFIDGQDLYVRWDNMNTALNRDVVEYIILENDEPGISEERRYEARIVRVVERHRVQFTGDLVYKEGDRTYVLLDNPRLNKVVSAPKSGLPVGEKVMVKLTNFDLDHLEGEIVKAIGHRSDPGVDVRAILEEFRVSEKFPEEIEEIERGLRLDIEGHRRDAGRRDLTNIPFATIDPDNSKDFDDAIAAEREGRGFRLRVAIADVWSYIRSSPALVEEARNRSTSIYFLDSVIPMLPETLCNDFCSLVPGAERCAVVLEIRTDREGRIRWDTMEIFPAIIRSRRRFTYGEVNDFFDGKNPLKEDGEEVRESLRVGFELYRLLEQQRVKRGYVHLENAETKMTLDERGNITSCTSYMRGHAQFMIENFMILANEGVARFLTRRELPGIFRIHDRPEPNRIAAFIAEVRKLNFIIRSGDENINQKVIFRWFQDNKNHPLLDTIGTLLLRSLPKAIYSVTNAGHFGINLDNYLHFTSPIRRFPDVMVHRMLWEYVFEGAERPKPDHRIYRELKEIAKHCTEREIEATEISRTVETAKIIQYLNTKLETIFRGRVVSTTKYGAFVRLDELHVEGFIRSRESLKLGDSVLIKPMYNNREMKLIKIL